MTKMFRYMGVFCLALFCFGLIFFRLANINQKQILNHESPAKIPSKLKSKAAIQNSKGMKAQANLIDKARELVRSEEYEQALELYQESLKPEYWLYEWETGMSRGGIRKIFVLQHKYDKALEALQWHLERNKEKYEPKRLEILALKKFHDTSDPSLIYEHIEAIKKQFVNWLPPNGGAGTLEISTILRLYDTIGDHDAGIAYIDKTMAYLQTEKKARNEDYAIYDRVATAEQATQCAELDKRVKERQPEWRACNLIREHLLVREAFEKDKAESTKGRATKALIQSDYFPW